MNIALMAHDSKKELMSNFCTAYRDILEQHHLFATGTTGSLVIDATSLKVTLLANGPLGEQQIIARVAYNEIDLVIFFRDYSTIRTDRQEVKILMQYCDSNNIPIATNIATAEILIKALSRGDLDWRNNKHGERKPV
jgi:methylglyoxal synthase